MNIFTDICCFEIIDHISLKMKCVYKTVAAGAINIIIIDDRKSNQDTSKTLLSIFEKILINKLKVKYIKREHFKTNSISTTLFNLIGSTKLISN